MKESWKNLLVWCKGLEKCIFLSLGFVFFIISINWVVSFILFKDFVLVIVIVNFVGLMYVSFRLFLFIFSICGLNLLLIIIVFGSMRISWNLLLVVLYSVRVF